MDLGVGDLFITQCIPRFNFAVIYARKQTGLRIVTVIYLRTYKHNSAKVGGIAYEILYSTIALPPILWPNVKIR